MSKPYPWFYAVNDRPVQIVQLRDGGADCLVLDMRTGNFVPDRRYFAYTVPGSGKDVDAFSASEFAWRVAAIRAQLLRRWAERLCRAQSGAEQDIREALGVATAPPPLRATAARVRGGEIGLATVELELPPQVLWRGAL